MEVSISDVRTFWDSKPCNIGHSNSEFGSKQYFDEVEGRKYFVEPHIPKFAEFPKWKGKKVLEIGFGIGTDAINFARAGANYTGIELSPESLKICKKRFDVFDLPGVLHVGNVENLNDVLQPQVFDLIYSFGVLHHTPSIAKSLANLRRFTHENSVLKMMVYARDSWKQGMINLGLDQPEAQFGCPIANSYTKQEICDLLSPNGFKVNSIKQDHIFPYVVEEYKKYNYVKQPYFSQLPSGMFEFLESTIGWHLLVEAGIS